MPVVFSTLGLGDISLYKVDDRFQPSQMLWYRFVKSTSVMWLLELCTNLSVDSRQNIWKETA